VLNEVYLHSDLPFLLWFDVFGYLGITPARRAIKRLQRGMVESQLDAAAREA
jgi:hypothetical protein